MVRSIRRRAFTLVELLVSIAVVALLLSLILPAVANARNTAARASCAEKLRQMGIACQSVIADRDKAPGAFGKGYGSDRWGIAPHVLLLPFLEQSEVYDSINLSEPLRMEANRTAAQRPMAMFHCPSDGGIPDGRGFNSYRFNGGTESIWIPLPQLNIPGGNGYLSAMGAKRTGEFTKGLSKVAAVAERVVGSGGKILVPERDFNHLDTLAVPLATSAAEDACSRATGARSIGQAGFDWLMGGPFDTWYNHVWTPNYVVPDCILSLAEEPVRSIVTARSWHPGGANVAMGDGSVFFASSNIAKDVWKSMGSCTAEVAGQ